MYKYGLYVWLARTTVGISGNTLKEDGSGSVTEWTIHHTGVTGHPTQVCQRAKNVSGLKIKDELQETITQCIQNYIFPTSHQYYHTPRCQSLLLASADENILTVKIPNLWQLSHSEDVTDECVIVFRN